MVAVFNSCIADSEAGTAWMQVFVSLCNRRIYADDEALESMGILQIFITVRMLIFWPRGDLVAFGNFL